MRSTLICLAAIWLAMAAWLGIALHIAGDQSIEAPPVVDADYQQCFTVIPGPLRPSRPHLNGDNRMKEIV